MRAPTSTVLALLCAAALAGCLGTEEPAAEVEPADASAAVNEPVVVEAPEGEADAPGATLREVPISWQGGFPTGACVPSGPNSCTPAGAGDWNTWHELDVAGAPRSVEATMTWTATAPDTERLWLSLLAWKPCGDTCVEGRVVGEPVLGASPLTLSVAGLALEEGEGLALGVNLDNPLAHPGGLPVYGYVVHDQSFEVEGVLVEEAPGGA